MCMLVCMIVAYMHVSMYICTCTYVLIQGHRNMLKCGSAVYFVRTSCKAYFKLARILALHLGAAVNYILLVLD